MTEDQIRDIGMPEKTPMAPAELPPEEVPPAPPMKPKEPKKKLWIMIVAIIVAIALVSTAVYVLIQQPEEPWIGLEARTVPVSVELAQGQKARIYAFADFVNGTDREDVSASVAITWTWATAAVGSLQPGIAENGTKFVTISETVLGNGVLNASFLYNDIDTGIIYRDWLDIPVNVTAPILDYVQIIPAELVTLINTTTAFTAKAFMTDDTEAVGATYGWTLEGDPVGNISTATGDTTTFDSTAVGEALLNCTATIGADSVTGTVEIEVLAELPPEKVASKIYNIGNVDYNDYWYNRTAEEKVIHATYPYVEVWQGTGADNWTYVCGSMNVTAENVSAVNTTVAPWYVPQLNPVITGGNIELRWRAHYLTWAEAYEDYDKAIVDWFDGWFFRWNGTITMDKTAAKMVLNITDADFDDFDEWKTFSFGEFQNKWSAFLAYEASTRWNIYPAYYYQWNPLYEDYDIEKVGDKIVFHINDHLSWGAESLLGRWWRETFLQYEYWPENIYFNANIGPLWSSFNLQMDITYSFYGEEGYNGNAAWKFENMHADELLSPPGSYYKSQVNWYWELDPVPQYLNQMVASSLYSTWQYWDYTPWGWKLPTEHHTLTVEWPSTDQFLGYNHTGIIGDYSDNFTGYLKPLWIEPTPGELPNNIMIDYANNTLTFKGPFEPWSWSKNTWALRGLTENWSDTGDLLPRGVPYIEFHVVTDESTAPIAIMSSSKIFGLRLSYDKDDESTWHNWTYLARVNTDIDFNGTASWDLDGTISTYQWDFGDGSTPTGESVVQNWAATGTYQVTLTVTDNSTLTAVDRLNIMVVTNIPPVAKITGPNFGNVDQVLNFSGSESIDWDGSIVNYTWDMGDGNMSYGVDVSHAYATEDLFTIKLTVRDNEGATGNITHKVTTMSPDPIAKIIMNKTGIVGETVTIDGDMSMSPVPGLSIVNWTWDFGDGSPTAWGNITTHSWSTPGTYLVELIVRDNDGRESLPGYASIKIANADISGGALGISLSRHSLLPDEQATMTVKIVDAKGELNTTASGSATITCNETVGVTIPASITVTNGIGTGTVSFANTGSYRIDASFDVLTGSDFATVADHTIEIKIYDIFDYELYDFWIKRDTYYSGGDERLEGYYTSPTVHIYRSDTDVYDMTELYTTYRVNMEARMIPEISMHSPTFIPFAGEWSSYIDEYPLLTGGNATYDVYFQYYTTAEYQDLYDRGIVQRSPSVEDGWVVNVTATLTMDREAAARLAGVNPTWTEAQILYWWNDDSYWIDYKEAWLNWFYNESWDLDSRLDIHASYDGFGGEEFPFTSAVQNYNIDVRDAGNTVEITMWRINWGEDVQLMRQLFYGGENYGNTYPDWTLAKGVLPMECWYEDFYMTVDIHPTHANVTLDTGVTYGWRAWNSDDAPDDVATWRWEPILSDYDYEGSIPGGGQATMSELEPWEGYVYPSLDPGSSAYGEDITYTYAPVVFDLELGESLLFERPDGIVVGFLPKKMIGDWYLYNDMISKWGYAELHVSGVPATDYLIDGATGDVIMVGPFTPPVTYLPSTTVPYEPAPRIEIWI